MGSAAGILYWIRGPDAPGGPVLRAVQRRLAAATDYVHVVEVPPSPLLFEDSGFVIVDSLRSCSSGDISQETMSSDGFALPAPAIAFDAESSAVFRHLFAETSSSGTPCSDSLSNSLSGETMDRELSAAAASSLEASQGDGIDLGSLESSIADSMSARLQGDSHGISCFRQMLEREKQHAGEWAVFYHAYTSSALLYEVNAAMAHVLFGFAAERAPLPRLLFHHSDFAGKFSPDGTHHAQILQDSLELTASCSLLASGPEGNIPEYFSLAAGQQQEHLSHRQMLNELLSECGVPRHEVKRLGQAVVALAAKHGLDVRQFGGAASASGRDAHVLQVFIRRNLVDKLAYAVLPSGQRDGSVRFSTRQTSDTSCSDAQARVVCQPETFMQESCVRMHVASADATFHSGRWAFQKDLANLCSSIMSNGNHRMNAVMGICGGRKANRWAAHDQNGSLSARNYCRSTQPPHRSPSPRELTTSRAIRASNRLQMGRQLRGLTARVPRRNARQRQMCV